jgi:predicted phosphodiesterase
MTKKQKQEQILIELYNSGKTDIELAHLFETSERTIQRRLARLRVKKRIKNRRELPISQDTTVVPATIEETKPLNWKIPKSRKKSTHIDKSFSPYLVIADPHIPYVNQSAVKAILKLMDDITFDGFIILGDYMDMTPISHWLQKKRKRKSLENKRMKADYIEGNKLLDEFDKRLPEGCDKRYFYGNHERFYYDLIEEYPALEGYFEPKTQLKLEERGYKVYDKINHIERIGRLSFTHGIYHVQNYVKKHIEEFKTNVIFGHLHSPRMRFSASPAKQIEIAGYCVGCLCNMNPAYMQGRPHKWAHGFGIVYFYEGHQGFFDVDLKRIVKGRFVYEGKLYDGNN